MGGVLLVGFVVGFGQWFLLRYYLPNARAWILATGMTLGLMLPLSISFFLVVNPDRAISAGAVTGVVVGFAQRLVLHRSSPDARWWIVASIVGMSAGLYAGTWVYYNVLRAVSGIVNNGLMGATIGLVYGAITGVAMVWLLYRMMAQDDEI